MTGSPLVEGFVFADLERRTFVALNREQTAYHLIHPAADDDQRVRDGLLTAGLLTCECRGGRFRGRCYQVEKAEAALRQAGMSAVADMLGSTDEVPVARFRGDTSMPSDLTSGERP
jgi:hypothetical protein